jgi:hypothetical protein
MRSDQQAICFVAGLTDKLGRGVDPEIKKPVAAFYLLGIKTTGSCQGHQDSGLSYPWIDISSPYDQVFFLEKELALFHFVKKGRGLKSSLRLVPKRVKDIADHQHGNFSLELKEINNWAEKKLKVAKTSG